MARKAGPVGRDDVLAELRRVVDGAVAGRGRLLLLAGEAGIGKTTMLTTAAGFAESRGVRVAWGWGWPGEGAPGYWPWVQVMRILGLDRLLILSSPSAVPRAARRTPARPDCGLRPR
jgi:hypothetical protein